jgi:hypothetical protein
VLVYAHRSAECAEARRLAELAEGIVVIGAPGARLARQLRGDGFAGRVLHDPAEYEHDPDRPRMESLFGLAEDALERQAALGVTAYLSPSAYVDAGDHARLRQVLADGVSFCRLARKHPHRARAYIELPIAKAWLSKGLYPSLRASVAAVADPIALMVGDCDPLGSATAVRNLIDCLRTKPTTSMIRTDASGLGVLAWGCGFAAVGITPTVRHFPGWGTKGFAKVTDHSPRVLSRTLLKYARGSRLDDAAGDDGLFDCGCRICNGRSIRRLRDPIDEPIANEHSAAVLTDIATWLRSLARPDRPAAWRDECKRAVSDAATLESLTGVIFGPPPALKGWASLP